MATCQNSSIPIPLTDHSGMSMKPTKHYLIHVYNDGDFKCFLKSIPADKAKTAKQALKIMKDAAYKDIVAGHYYYYNLLEQKTTTLVTYPNTETSK